MSLPFLKSAPGETPVVVQATFAVPASRVYRAWTRSEELARWFGPPSGPLEKVEVDFRVGGRWRFCFHKDEDRREWLEGEYLAVEPDALLAFSWTHVREFDDGRREATPESKVTVTFSAEGDGTNVRLVHEAIVREEARRGVGSGWVEVLGKLQTLVEGEMAAAGSS